MEIEQTVRYSQWSFKTWALPGLFFPVAAVPAAERLISAKRREGGRQVISGGVRDARATNS